MPLSTEQLAEWWDETGRYIEAVSDFYSIKTWEELTEQDRVHIRDLYEACQH